MRVRREHPERATQALQSDDAPPGADERLYRAAQEAGRRRAELTERSVVRLTRLLLPA